MIYKQISKPYLSAHKVLKEKCLMTVILLFVMIVAKAISPWQVTTDPTPVQDVKNITVTNRSFGQGIQVKTFYSAVVDTNNTKWFLTDIGIVSFDGKKWSTYNKNLNVPGETLKSLAYGFSSSGPELWITSSKGATVASLPVDTKSGTTTYNTQNSTILSDNVLSAATGKGSLRWFGTDRGISAFLDNKWLPYTGYSYQREYPESMFTNFPITCMATSPDGNLVYAGTDGGGVARVYRNEVDGISGASVHAYWGPINMPSDKVYSICIAPDGTQWYGTNRGVAKHTGVITMDNWTVFSTSNGLIDNFVQAIAIDKNGTMWFGTKGGVSVFDGTTWNSYSLKDGLNSNNILCITSDKNGVLWLGTDNGVISYDKGEFCNYR